MKVTDEKEALVAMDKLHQLGVRIVVLTSLDSTGADLVTYASVKSNAGERKVWKTIAPRLDTSFTGTGDLFAALFLGWYKRMGEAQLPEALQTTLATMQTVLKRTKAHYEVQCNGSLGAAKVKELRLVQSLDVILTPPKDTAIQLVEVATNA